MVHCMLHNDAKPSYEERERNAMLSRSCAVMRIVKNELDRETATTSLGLIHTKLVLDPGERIRLYTMVFMTM